MYFMAGLDSNPGRFFSLLGIGVLGAVTGLTSGVSIAAATPSLPIALTITPLLMMPTMLTSGMFINTATMPWGIRWLKYLSVMRYSYEGMTQQPSTFEK